MEVTLHPGKYVLAVSGGVDSMVLLDILAHAAGVELVVAHFDHGIRDDSDEDRQLVEAAAGKYGLPFVFARAELGPGASEAAARAARYAFLQQARLEHGARAIITAHHQDDLIETALLNMLRGTGSRGLTSLRSTEDIKRPLLHIPKSQLQDYAASHGLRWREDSTNQADRYRRNYVRHHVTPRLTSEARQKLLHYIETAHRLHREIDAELETYIDTTQLGRQWFTMLPHAVSAEVMALWLRSNGLSFNRASIQRLVVFAKTAAPGKLADLDSEHVIGVSKNHITLEHRVALR
jgi:tRNA(Ile)-lysidine synthetase-like protein